jgi:hypothetical protein
MLDSSRVAGPSPHALSGLPLPPQTLKVQRGLGCRGNQRIGEPLHLGSSTFDPYRLATLSMGNFLQTLRISVIFLRLPVERRRAKHLLPSPLPSAQVGGKGGRQRGKGGVATLLLSMWPRQQQLKSCINHKKPNKNTIGIGKHIQKSYQPCCRCSTRAGFGVNALFVGARKCTPTNDCLSVGQVAQPKLPSVSLSGYTFRSLVCPWRS